MEIKKNNKLQIKISFFIIILFFLQLKSYGQFKDTITNVYKDTVLISWVENYILKTGYIIKSKKGYQVATFSSYYKDITGLYSLHIIENQKNDTTSITLYRLHVGSDHDNPMIIKQVSSLNNNFFDILGSNSSLESVYQLYLFFNKFNRFTIGTQKYCYDMLFQNHYNYLNH